MLFFQDLLITWPFQSLGFVFLVMAAMIAFRRKSWAPYLWPLPTLVFGVGTVILLFQFMIAIGMSGPDSGFAGIGALLFFLPGFVIALLLFNLCLKMKPKGRLNWYFPALAYAALLTMAHFASTTTAEITARPGAVMTVSLASRKSAGRPFKLLADSQGKADFKLTLQERAKIEIRNPDGTLPGVLEISPRSTNSHVLNVEKRTESGDSTNTSFFFHRRIPLDGL